MIKRLQNKNIDIANKMHSVFLVSYAVEAKLLKATDFPPLKRRLESYMDCGNDFFGYTINQDLGGIIEIKQEKSFIHIQSLVVNPKYFRKGIGKKLMEYVLNSFDDKPFMVETGVENMPATALYKKLNFKEVKQWDTSHGIRKIRFERDVKI